MSRRRKPEAPHLKTQAPHPVLQKETPPKAPVVAQVDTISSNAGSERKRDGIVTWVGPSNFSPPATQTPESCLNPSTNFAPFRTSMPHDICMQMNAMIPEILQYPNGPCAEVVYTLTLQGVPVEVLCGQNFGKDGHMDSKRHDCRLCISIRAACQHVTSPRKCMSGTAQPKRNAMAMASRARRLNSQRRRSSAWLVRARTNGTHMQSKTVHVTPKTAPAAQNSRARDSPSPAPRKRPVTKTYI